jgi:hypothetical protein
MDKLSVKKGLAVLFLDMQEIESATNIRLTLNKASKCEANPVLQLGDHGDWDRWRASIWAGSAIYDYEDECFKIWYYGVSGPDNKESSTGYATSADGIMWKKPDLNLYDVKTTKNNIVYTQYQPSGLRIGEHFCVTKDYLETDEHRKYKGLTRRVVPELVGKSDWPFASASDVIYSSDGIHWTIGPKPIDAVDMTNIIIDDCDPDPNKRIKIYGVVGIVPSGTASHTFMGFGRDMEHIQISPDPIMITEENSTVHLSCCIHYQGYYLAFYNYSLWREYYGYHGAASSRLMDPRRPKDLKAEEGWGGFIGDTRLAVSRDGISKFIKINPYDQIIERGEKGQWDDAYIVTSNPVVKDDDLYLFYSGSSEPAASIPQEYDISPIRSGIAKIEHGRLTYISSADRLTTAVVTTIPIVAEKPCNLELRLNVSDLIPFRDWIEVEVLDAATNEPIPGFTRRECQDIYLNGFSRTVCWESSRSLVALIGTNGFKLRFFIYGKAKLYSFMFV